MKRKAVKRKIRGRRERGGSKSEREGARGRHAEGGGGGGDGG